MEIIIFLFCVSATKKIVEKGKTYLAAAEAEADEDGADVNHPNFDTSVSCLLACLLVSVVNVQDKK